jgi:nucleoid-associated protein Lsr2
MAQKTVVQLIDDLDGTASDSIETIQFGLDGVTYEIDLSDDHAGLLRDNLAEFIASARRTGGRVKRTTAASPPRSNGVGRSREQTQAIREWARKNGYDVSNRGRIPAAVIEAFEAGAGQPSRRRTK